jgi:hypothetical protein
MYFFNLSKEEGLEFFGRIGMKEVLTKERSFLN